MPKVSVIVPAFNMAQFLPFALDSVMHQTFPDWEIIVVDDGSTDGTGALLETYRERLGAKFRGIYQQNQGLPHARNVAINSSSGEYLAFLDSDDAWFPHRLERQLKVIEMAPEVGLVHASVVLIDEHNNPLRERTGPLQYQSGRVAKHIYARRSVVTVSSVLIRRACIDAIGLFDEAFGAVEDRDLWFRIATRFSFAYVAEPLAYYRVSRFSMSRDPERMFRNQMRFLDKHYGSAGCGLYEKAMALANCHALRGQAYWEVGNMRRAFAGYFTALAFRPWCGSCMYALLRLGLGTRRDPGFG